MANAAVFVLVRAVMTWGKALGRGVDVRLAKRAEKAKTIGERCGSLNTSGSAQPILVYLRQAPFDTAFILSLDSTLADSGHRASSKCVALPSRRAAPFVARAFTESSAPRRAMPSARVPSLLASGTTTRSCSPQCNSVPSPTL